jgi:hypothetical protein
VGRRSSYLAVLAGAVVGAGVLAVVTLVAPDEQAVGTPATTSTPPETPTTSSPALAPGTSARPTVAGAARPAPAGSTPRSTATSPDTSAPATTTATDRPTPVPTGVRFSGELRFGSFHLDLAQPRDVPGTNVWPLAPDRLHGDDGYWLAEWLGDTVPGQAECVAELGKRATRDAEHLIVGSRVCGKTPGGRTFLVDVTALDGSAITGRVTVWEQ